MKNQKSLGNKGFSLVELIVVIAIMAVLMGVLAPTLIGNIEKSRESKDLTNLDTIYNAVNTALSTESGAKAAKDNNYTGAVKNLSDFLAATATDKFSASMKETLGQTVDTPSCASASTDGYFIYISSDLKAVVFCKPADGHAADAPYANFAQAEKNDKTMYVGNSEVAKSASTAAAGGQQQGGQQNNG